MRDELLLYYERELSFLRQMSAQFAEKYPKVAGRLMIEPDRCNDPHVERLLESFAFLAARVHLKIDDEFPEITESLLGIVYPHLIRPLPSMTIAQFTLDPDKGKLTTGLRIERDSMLYSRPVDGVPSKFRTCYDTTLWPVTVTEADWRPMDRLHLTPRPADAVGAIRIQLKTPPDLEFGKLEMDSLRFYLTGEGALVHTVYELLCCNLAGVIVRDPTPRSRLQPTVLPASSLRPVGFEPDQGMLPYDRRSLLCYRLLQEYFTFPEKFFFIDISGLRQAFAGGYKTTAELVLPITKFEGDHRRQRLETQITARTFSLGCVPVVNLFPQTSEPILLDQHKYEYRVVPDARRPMATEIFSVDEVLSIKSEQQEIIHYEPFYSVRHAAGGTGGKELWIANRRASNRPNDPGTEIDLSLVDLSLRPVKPDTDTLTVRTTCTNRDLPARLPFGREAGDFELESGDPIKKIQALQKPTAPIRPPIGKAMQWRLISHLSLNYLSIVDGGREALQEILKLYNFSDTAYAEKVISGITDLRSSPHFARVVSENGIAFVRGTRVQVELDEEQFTGEGTYLFASVLEHFLGLYTSLNSFSQLVATTRQRKEPLRQWPPRAGRRILM